MIYLFLPHLLKWGDGQERGKSLCYVPCLKLSDFSVEGNWMNGSDIILL